MTGKKLLPLCLCLGLLLTGCATVAEYTSPTPPLGQVATATPTTAVTDIPFTALRERRALT